MAEQLKTLLDFLLFPNNEHFRDMRDSFLSSRFLFVILGAVGAKVGKRLLAPCSAEHDPEEFLKKPWNCLTEVEKDKVKNQPFKYLCLRHKIGAVHWGILHVLIRMVCIHVLPCILVLYWGWLECDGSTEMLRISFMVLYALYLISTVVVFFNKLCTDRLDFARLFLLPVELLSTDIWAPVWAQEPCIGWWTWLVTIWLWGTFGMEMMVTQFVWVLKPANPNSNLPALALFALTIYQFLLAGYCSVKIMSVPSGSGSTLPFWWCAGAFLGWTSFLGLVSFCAMLLMYRRWTRLNPLTIPSPAKTEKKIVALPFTLRQLTSEDRIPSCVAPWSPRNVCCNKSWKSRCRTLLWKIHHGCGYHFQTGNQENPWISTVVWCLMFFVEIHQSIWWVLTHPQVILGKSWES